MDIVVNAIVIKTVDYKDNDKILTLYSLEKGKLTAGIKGVKKAGAKLKFAAEPFCFAEYVLAEKNSRYTVTNASYIDAFYNLRLDVLKYYASACIIDVINSLTEEGVVEPLIFQLTLNATKNVAYQKNEKQSLALFLYKISDYLGYGVSNLNCHCCNDKITNRVFFRYSDAAFSCENCRTENFSEITVDTYDCLTEISKLNFDNVTDVTLPDVKINKLLKFLFFYLSVKTDTKLKSANSFIEYLNGKY